MALSPNYGWSEPDNSSLVKNGAQDIRALGDAIDTSVWNVGYGQAGKNKIINGDFRINQRAFTSTTTSNAYGFDRWQMSNAGGTSTYSAQTFTTGAAPVAGYESTNFACILTSGQSAAGDYSFFRQLIEDVRTFAGQTVTVSFWAKAATGTPKIGIEAAQVFGTGGSPSAQVQTAFGSVTISTSWTRYSISYAIPSISGKTIGTTANTSSLNIGLWVSAGATFATRASSIGIQNNTFDIWGVQVEAGSVATAFQTATGTIQGELAACQRYYWQSNADGGSAFANLTSFSGVASSSTALQFAINTPVSMRVKPSSVSYSTIRVVDGTNALTTISAVTVSAVATAYQPVLDITLTGATQFRMYAISANNSTSGYIALSAEL